MNDWHYLPTTLFAGGNNTLSNQLLLITELDRNLFVRSSQVLVVRGTQCNIALFSSVEPTHYQRSARTTFHRTTADLSWTTTSSPRHRRCSRARVSGPSPRRYRGPGPLRVSITGAVPEPEQAAPHPGDTESQGHWGWVTQELFQSHWGLVSYDLFQTEDK